MRPTVFQYGRQRGGGKDKSGKGTGGTAGTDNPYAATVGLYVRNRAKTSDGSPQPRPPACESALKMEGKAVLSRKNTARTCLSWCHSCLSLCCPCPRFRHEKLVALGILPVHSTNRQDACSPSFMRADDERFGDRLLRPIKPLTYAYLSAIRDRQGFQCPFRLISLVL